ncbi:MAG TPA: hypothetical protein VGE64_03855 [Xanthomonadaceae bacterium]
MAERFAHVKAELLAGAPGFDSEDQAFEDAQTQAVTNGEPRVVVRLVAEVKRDPKPPVIVTRYE